MIAAYRTVAGNRNLVRLFLGEFISSIGDWLYLVALLVVVYRESSDPFLLGVIGGARIIPYVLLSRCPSRRCLRSCERCCSGTDGAS